RWSRPSGRACPTVPWRTARPCERASSNWSRATPGTCAWGATRRWATAGARSARWRNGLPSWRRPTWRRGGRHERADHGPAASDPDAGAAASQLRARVCDPVPCRVGGWDGPVPHPRALGAGHHPPEWPRADAGLPARRRRGEAIATALPGPADLAVWLGGRRAPRARLRRAEADRRAAGRLSRGVPPGAADGASAAGVAEALRRRLPGQV